MRRIIPNNLKLQFLGAMCIAMWVLGASAASGQTEEAAGIAVQTMNFGQVELAMWNDPDFRRRFTESYIAAVDIEPRVTTEERNQMQRVLELISADQMNEAADRLARMRNEASSAVFDFTLANIYFQQGNLDQAAAAYQIAVDKYPRFRRAWKNLGLIYIRRSEFQKALPALTRVIELGGGDATTYGLLGYAYSSVNNHLSAESAYRMAILLDPAAADWKMGLARSLFKQGRYGEAALLFGQMIEEQPDRADLWLLQANAYIGLNQPLKAAQIYELVEHLGASSADSLNMLGDIYVNEGLYEIAVGAYIRAMEKAPQSSMKRAIRAAQVLAARGAFGETRQLIDSIERLGGAGIDNDMRKDMLKLRARLAVADGSGDDEVRILMEIVELDPLDGEALILLGQHSKRMGDNEKAVFYYERAAAIPGHEADALVRHGQLLVRMGKFAEALPLLRRAQQLNPRDNVQSYLEQVERAARSR
ncbi:MAG TPA: tetratricopeptide repeat protein [Sedimentisphaerales bacterium]|nr:tetratricopeptide repeat protein [Sedimentisphaerales bacterium]